MSEKYTDIHHEFEGFRGDYNTQEYMDRNYPQDETLPDDAAVASGVIKYLAKMIDLGEIRPERLRRGIDLGNSGAAVMPAFAAPLLQAGGPEFTWSDIGPDQLAAAAAAVGSLSTGQLGRWRSDQAEYAAADPRWEGAFSRAGRLGKIATVNFLDTEALQAESYDVVTTGHCPESVTDKPAIWEEGVGNAIAAVKPGGVMIMTATLGATRYPAGDKWYPSLPIGLADIARVTEGRFRHRYLEQVGVIRGYRPEGDTSGYSGMAAFVGVKAA